VFKQNRTIGIEMEGYFNQHPYDANIPHARVGTDGSLRHTNWDDDDDDEDFDFDLTDEDRGREYGVEVRTEPLADISVIPEIFEAMRGFGFQADNTGGTHIHVDISDLTNFEKIKLLRFGKGIEKIIFALIEDSRFDNGYCSKLPSGWRKVFWRRGPYRRFDFDAHGDEHLYHDLSRTYSLNNGRGHWMNVFGSHYNTVEFRVFHGVQSAEELLWQAKMVHNIVELVKHCDVGQINFMVKSLYDSVTVDEVIAKFCDLLDIDGREPVGRRGISKLQGVISRHLQEITGTVASDQVAVASGDHHHINAGTFNTAAIWHSDV
jgi:hypothetical protein